jgi:parvulin-like peptidyl-prolyl isomerase
MKLLLLVACIVGGLSAQTATVNGKPVSQGELDALLKFAPAELRSVLTKDPSELLRYYGLVDRMAEIAEKDNLPGESPLKEQLALARKQILTNAVYERFFTEHPSTPESEQKFYAAHIDDYTSALVKTAFVPIHAPEDESAARSKAQSLVKQLAMGAEFDELVEKYPADGFPAVFKKSDANVPQAIRTAVFALKKGETTTPIVLSIGVYLVRLQEISVKALDEVRGDVAQRLSTEGFFAWIEGIRKTVVIDTAPKK